MSEDEFIKLMRERNDCPQGTAEKWIQFAKECVESEQYVGFKPTAPEQAVQDWLSSMYAAFYFTKRYGGQHIVQAIYKLAEIPHCLYPYEIIGTIGYLKDGGDLDRLVDASINSLLDYFGKMPTLADTEKDYKYRKRKQHDVR